jgi:hypothetical protein
MHGYCGAPVLMLWRRTGLPMNMSGAPYFQAPSSGSDDCPAPSTGRTADPLES